MLAQVTTILGGMTPANFLRTHWQKRPLLVKQALPEFRGIIDERELFALARRPDAISRLVVEHPRTKRGRWELHEGPFEDLAPSDLPADHWSLLVQGVEGLHPGGWALLQEFAFIPAARVDDLMISYAADGGSVGPHEDLYDVFLLQGPGRRRWQISTHGDHAFDPTAPIKILKKFKAEKEYLLEPGDMLYLPPGVAHLGIAEGPGFTYSIGFVAPSHESLLQNFLAYLGQRLEPTIDPHAMYEDPHLKQTSHPLALGHQMISTVERLLTRIHWNRAQVEEFLGRLLTGPKPHVQFARPQPPISRSTFAQRLRGDGSLGLALPTRGLLDARGRHVFLNGEMHSVAAKTARLFTELLSARSMSLPLSVSAADLPLFYDLYYAGFITLS